MVIRKHNPFLLKILSILEHQPRNLILGRLSRSLSTVRASEICAMQEKLRHPGSASGNPLEPAVWLEVKKFAGFLGRPWPNRDSIAI